MLNKPKSKEIAQLHWETDYERIVFLLGAYVFPWDLHRALEFALFRTFAVPSISKLLDRTGEFKNRTRKRYDDTELILAEILHHGLDSPRAKQAFRRMNKMHNSYNISNDDFLYVLGTFVFVPVDWIAQYAYRPMTENERLAIFKFFQEMGKRMNIKEVPSTYEVFQNFYHHYEQTHFRKADSNVAVAQPTIDLLLSFYLPKPLYFVGKSVMTCFMDDLLLEAMQLPKANPLLKKLVNGGMQARAFVVDKLPERKKPYLLTELERPTYPNGYKIEDLGTFPKKK